MEYKRENWIIATVKDTSGSCPKCNSIIDIGESYRLNPAIGGWLCETCFEEMFLPEDEKQQYVATCKDCGNTPEVSGEHSIWCPCGVFARTLEDWNYHNEEAKKDKNYKGPTLVKAKEKLMKLKDIVDVQITSKSMPKLNALYVQNRDSETTYEIDGNQLTINEVADYLNQRNDSNCYEVVNQSEIQILSPVEYVSGEIIFEDSPKEKIETTRSYVLEFPNGEIIQIPEPKEEGWTGEKMDYSKSWPAKHWKDFLWNYDSVKHLEGIIITNEYARRINAENPRVISWIDWTRTVKTETKKEEVYEPYQNYPLLLGKK